MIPYAQDRHLSKITDPPSVLLMFQSSLTIYSLTRSFPLPDSIVTKQTAELGPGKLRPIIERENEALETLTNVFIDILLNSKDILKVKVMQMYWKHERKTYTIDFPVHIYKRWPEQ